MHKIYLYILLFSLMAMPLQAEETLLVGEVHSVVGEAVPNASIYFRGTKIGTTTDTLGHFFLHVDLGGEARLKISAVGYQPVTLLIQPGQRAGLDIVLQDKTTALEDVFVSPGRNPALAILDSVRAHKPTGTRVLRHVQYGDDELFQTERHLDFYETSMPFGSISFLSPLAAGGKAYYNYYLIDSLQTADGCAYVVDYIPRNGFDPLLSGRMTIRRSDWLLADVTATVPYHANINYLKRLDYRVEYEAGQIATDTMHTEWNLGVWRDTTATTPEPLIRVAKWLAYAVRTGYFRGQSIFDYGRVDEFIRYSDYEGLHLGLPFRTNERLMPHVSLGGYVAYGFRDRGVKWLAEVEANLPTERDHRVGAYARDHYTYSGASAAQNLATFVLRDMAGINLSGPTTAYRRQQIQTWWQADWTDSQQALPGLRTRLAVDLSRVGITTPERGWLYRNCDFVETVSLQNDFHLIWRQPTLYLHAEMGSFRPMGQTVPGRLYGKLSAVLEQRVSLRGAGTLSYAISVGGTLGDVPQPMLDPLGGSYGWTYEPTRFSMLRGTYASRLYATAHLHWNGGGILFNRIPGVRYARLRELVFLKAGYADCMTIPHVEGGIGIGNVLGVGEFYFVARMTPARPRKAVDYNEPSWMGFRFRTYIGL